MLSETGPEFPPESDSPNEDEKNGTAGEDQLVELQKKINGERQDAQPTGGQKTREPERKSPREPHKVPFADVGKKQEVPKDIVDKGPEDVRNYLEARAEKPDVPIPEEETPPQTEESQGQIVSDESITPSEAETPTPPAGERQGFFQRFFGGGQKESKESAAANQTQQPQAQPPTRTMNQPEQDQQTEQPGVKPIEEEVQERYSNLKSGDKFLIGKNEYTVDKFAEEEVSGEKIVRVRLKEANGNTYYRYDHEIKAEIEKQVIADRKEAEKAEKEQAKAEREEQREKYKEAKSSRKTDIEEKVSTLRQQLEDPNFNRATSSVPIILDGKEYKYVQYNPERSNPYVVQDENGNNRYLSKDEINRALRSEATLENKAKIENLKPESQAKEVSGRTLEQVSKGAKNLMETAEKNPVGRFLMDRVKGFWEHIRPWDKDMKLYLGGLAVGGTVNAGTILFTPFLAFGPGRALRSLIMSAGITALSKGANLWLNRGLAEIGKKIGTYGKEFTGSAVNTLNKARDLEAQGNLEESMKLRNGWSKNTFLKSGYKERSDYWAWTQDISRAALINSVELQHAKYTRLQHGIKSFSGGLAAGSIGVTGIFGLENFFSFADDKMPRLGLFGGGGDVEAPTESPGPPTEAPGVEPPGEEQPPGEVPEEPPAEPPGEEQPPSEEPEQPTTPEAPANFAEIISNPEFSNSIEIQQGDTLGSILANSGYEIDWGPNNAELFGAHLQANYDMLQGMHENVAASGIAVEDFPTQEEISTLVQQAKAGDPVAMHRLTESLHWIPAGGNINVLTPEGMEQARTILARGG